MVIIFISTPFLDEREEKKNVGYKMTAEKKPHFQTKQIQFVREGNHEQRNNTPNYLIITWLFTAVT